MVSSLTIKDKEKMTVVWHHQSGRNTVVRDSWNFQPVPTMGYTRSIPHGTLPWGGLKLGESPGERPA